MTIDPDLSYKNPPKHIDRARQLRKQSPQTERMIWNALCSLRKETKLKFRRQHPLYPYVVDFACVSARLVIEIDGSSHDTTQLYDTKRERDICKKGWKIIRFTNEDVHKNLEGVILTILNQTESLKRPPPSPPVRTGGVR